MPKQESHLSVTDLRVLQEKLKTLMEVDYA
jgi:hypothetical protein